MNTITIDDIKKAVNDFYNEKFSINKNNTNTMNTVKQNEGLMQQLDTTNATTYSWEGIIDNMKHYTTKVETKYPMTEQEAIPVNSYTINTGENGLNFVSPNEKIKWSEPKPIGQVETGYSEFYDKGYGIPKNQPPVEQEAPKESVIKLYYSDKHQLYYIYNSHIDMWVISDKADLSNKVMHVNAANCNLKAAFKRFSDEYNEF